MKKSTKLWKNVVFGIINLATVSLLWDKAILCLAIIATAGTIVLIKEQDKRLATFWMVTGISGAIAEVIAIYFGAWTYSNPQAAGIPYWLPVLWANAGLFLKTHWELLVE